MQCGCTRLFRSVGAVLACVLMVLCTSTAFAQSSNGAEHFAYTNCSTSADGFTLCFTTDSVYTMTVTPSGTTHVTGNGQSGFTLTDPSGALVYHTADRIHFAELTRDGMIEVYNNTAKGTIVFPDGRTCSTRFIFRLINDELRVFREEPCTVL